MITHTQGPKTLYINGGWRPGRGSLLLSFDPFSQEESWKGPGASSTNVDEAVLAAKQAFLLWALLPFEKRRALLEKFGTLLEKEQDSLAEIISKETGKPLSESKQEVGSMIQKIPISLEAFDERCHEKRESKDGITIETSYRPHGVFAILAPFNFPAHLPNGHMVPALLAGNTIVMKASEHTPLVSEKVFQILDQVGFPPGVVNLLQGGKEVGKTLTQHPLIDGVLFTGSFATGQKIHTHFGPDPSKIVALEMGGNNPLVLTHISKIDKGVDIILKSAFLSSGQRCTCTRRLIMIRSVENNKIIEEVVKKAKQLKVGGYQEKPEPFMGPLINEDAAVKALTFQSGLTAKGGIPLLKLTLLKEKTGLVSPGIIDVTAVKERIDEEIFAPFLQIIQVKTFDEAIQEANNTSYGLVASLLSENGQEWEQFRVQIKAGVINWNLPTTGASSRAPFGGIKHSGNHRPSAFHAADTCSYPVASMIQKGVL